MRYVLAILILVSVPASAGNIVLESYTGERPADANRLLSPILDELSTRGFVGGDSVARTYDTQVSRAAHTPSGLPADFAAQSERGFRAWVSGKFDEAIKTLGPLVETAHANTGAFAKDQTLRDPLQKALIALALSQQRSGDPGATRATFSEILRSFPDTQMSRATYGPDAYDLFEQVRREIVAGGKGKLDIKVSDDTAAVFIDERFQAQGSTTAELVPGEYRVVVLLHNQPSRSHRVMVRAGATATMVVDVKQDQMLHTLGWTGFSFTSTAEREAHEPAYAAQFANVIGASAVAVVGIDQIKGRPAIVGSLVSLQNGREIRRASVAMDPDPSTERLKALARFLAGDDPAAGLEVQMGAAAAAKPVVGPVATPEPHDAGGGEEAPVTTAGRWGGYKWLAGGAALGALGTGVVLVALDGRCTMTPAPGRMCNDFYNFALAGYLTLGGGALLAGVSIWLFMDEARRPAHTAFVVPTRDGAFAGYATTW